MYSILLTYIKIYSILVTYRFCNTFRMKPTIVVAQCNLSGYHKYTTTNIILNSGIKGLIQSYQIYYAIRVQFSGTKNNIFSVWNTHYMYSWTLINSAIFNIQSKSHRGVIRKQRYNCVSFSHLALPFNLFARLYITIATLVIAAFV